MELMELSGRLNRAAEAVRSAYSGREQKVRDLSMFIDAAARINGALEHEIAAACLLHLSKHVARQLDGEGSELEMSAVVQQIMGSK